MKSSNKIIKRIEFTEQEFLDKLGIKGKLGFIFHNSLDEIIVFNVEDEVNKDESEKVIL